MGEMWDLLKTRRTSAKDLQWRDIFCKDEIEEKMIDWCTLHFAQASGTPLVSPQWADKLDIQNPGNILDNILDGKIPEVPEHKEAKEFFRASIRKSP